MQISNRLKTMSESPMRKLNSVVRAVKGKGRKIYPLNIGQPDIHTPESFITAIKNFSESVIGYTGSEGLPELIQSIQGYYKMYDIHFDEDEILVTNGGSEALLYAFMATCDIGDQLLIPEPYYTNYNTFAKMAGAEIIPIPSKVEEDFALPTLEKLESLIGSNVKAIMVTHPGNPTGKVYTKEEIMRIAELAKKYDLFIIADEVYREFVYDDMEYMSFAEIEDVKDRVIIADSISKRYSACGARIGSIASKNKELIKHALKLCQSRLAVSTLDQVGAAELMKTPKEYFTDTLEIYRKRRDVVYNALSEMEGVICGKPQGAFYIIAKLPIDDSDKFVRWLLEEFHMDNETVLLAPAQAFYASGRRGRDEVRLAYILDEDSLSRAMEILKEALKVYPGRKIG